MLTAAISQCRAAGIRNSNVTGGEQAAVAAPVPRRELAAFRNRRTCGTRGHHLRDPRAMGFWSQDPHPLSTACYELARVVFHATRYDRFRHVDVSASGNLSNQ